MSWGREVCLVTWHMCPDSGDKGGTCTWNDIPDGENWWFHAVYPVSGRWWDETAGPRRERGQKREAVASQSRLSDYLAV